jgi:hypothetical protein
MCSVNRDINIRSCKQDVQLLMQCIIAFSYDFFTKKSMLNEEHEVLEYWCKKSTMRVERPIIQEIRSNEIYSL